MKQQTNSSKIILNGEKSLIFMFRMVFIQVNMAFRRKRVYFPRVLGWCYLMVWVAFSPGAKLSRLFQKSYKNVISIFTIRTSSFDLIRMKKMLILSIFCNTPMFKLHSVKDTNKWFEDDFTPTLNWLANSVDLNL